MSETTHTPLPWIVSAPGIVRIGGEPIRCREIGAKKASGWIAIIQDEPNAGQSGDDNASLIARAVNSHAALVDALSATVCENCGTRIGWNGNDGCEICKQAREALRTAGVTK